MRPQKEQRTLLEVLDLREELASQVAGSHTELLRILNTITEGKGRQWGREYAIITRVAHMTVPGGLKVHTFRHAELEGEPTTAWSADWYTGKDDDRLRRFFQVDQGTPLSDLTWDATWEEQVGLDKADKAIEFSRLEARTGDLRRRLHAAEQSIARTYFGTQKSGRGRYFTVREVTVGRHKFWVMTDGSLSFSDAIIRVEVDPETKVMPSFDYRDRFYRKQRMNRKED